MVTNILTISFNPFQQSRQTITPSTYPGMKNYLHSFCSLFLTVRLPIHSDLDLRWSSSKLRGNIYQTEWIHSEEKETYLQDRWKTPVYSNKNCVYSARLTSIIPCLAELWFSLSLASRTVLIWSTFIGSVTDLVQMGNYGVRPATKVGFQSSSTWLFHKWKCRVGNSYLLGAFQ